MSSSRLENGVFERAQLILDSRVASIQGYLMLWFPLESNSPGGLSSGNAVVTIFVIGKEMRLLKCMDAVAL